MNQSKLARAFYSCNTYIGIDCRRTEAEAKPGVTMEAEEFKGKIAEVYRIADELSTAFRIEKCTPDGHLVGSFGKIAAKLAFGLEFGADLEEHNCTWNNGREKVEVQVRCTGAGAIALRREPVHLIALELSRSGSFTLLYNGPGGKVWQRIRHQKAAQKSIARDALLELYRTVPPEERLPLVAEGIL